MRLVEYVKAQFDKGRKMRPIDLRSADEYQRGHLPGARSVPLTELPARFAEVPTTNRVVLYYDWSPAEVELAYRFLKGQRYRNLNMMGERYKAWTERGHPIEQ